MFRLALPLALLAATAVSAQEPRPLPPLLAGRSGPGMKKIDAELGDTQGNLAPIAVGLKWLVNQQNPLGYWEFDPRDPKLNTKDWATSTGMALLPFLGANQTHAGDGKYQKQIADALVWLKNDLNLATGKFAHGSPQYMYGHAITTLALCEAYALTGDRALQPFAQSAATYIVKAQGADGSWGYLAGTTGDTSITGWQLQALLAAREGELTVPDATITKAVEFLNKVASGPNKAAFGYTSATGKAGTALTAVGLWSRYHFDGWNPSHAGFREGVAGLADPARRPKSAAQSKVNSATPEMYYYYYATQVMHRAAGDAWADWFLGPREGNKRVGGMRDWLVATQSQAETSAGSWNPDNGTIGMYSGRVGTTALALLTLETPYRYLRLYRTRP